MKKKIIWRLVEKPSPKNIQELVTSGILTKEEAREILFTETTEIEEEKKAEDFKDEIKFLRELVEKLSKNDSQVIETIRYIEKPYRDSPWYNHYITWCGTVSSGTNNSNFSSIKSF